MIKLKLIPLTALALLTASGLSSYQALANSCDGQRVERSLVMQVDETYRTSNASLSLCQVSPSMLAQLKGFVAGLNEDSADKSHRYAKGDFKALRKAYSAILQRKGHLNVTNAYQLGNKIYVIFTMDLDKNYVNYFTFQKDDYGLHYAAIMEQRNIVGHMLARSVASKKNKSSTNVVLNLAQSPAAILHLNGRNCADDCLNTQEVMAVMQMRNAVDEGHYHKIPNFYVSDSRKRLRQWLNTVPVDNKAQALNRFVLPQHIIYHFDFGSFSILGYVETQGEYERFKQGLSTGINPQHMYFSKSNGELKVANFSQETLIDEYLKSQLMLTLLEAKK